MFYGEFSHSLDPKGRLMLPAKHRQVLTGIGVTKLFVTRGLDGCLFLFTEKEWTKQEDKFKGLPFTKSEARRFNRLYFSGASCVELDGQGRFLIPQYLKEHASVDKEVVVIGVANRIEIWSKQRWEKFFAETKDNFEQIAEGLLDEENRQGN